MRGGFTDPQQGPGIEQTVQVPLYVDHRTEGAFNRAHSSVPMCIGSIARRC